MKSALTAAILGAVMFFAGVAVHQSQSAEPPPFANYDVNENGVINAADSTLVLRCTFGLMGADCATPYPCVPSAHYVTPVTAIDENGAPYFVTGRAFVPTEDPRYLPNLQGTPLVMRPCG